VVLNRSNVLLVMALEAKLRRRLGQQMFVPALMLLMTKDTFTDCHWAMHVAR
jgi:hypothetical protein